MKVKSESEVIQSCLTLCDPIDVVLKKTLDSPLDCKEIQPVHSKGDQPWVFIGRTDVKAETPILWPPESMRKHTVAPQFEKNHKMPLSRRDGGLLFLPDLESNPWSSLQTSQED